MLLVTVQALGELAVLFPVNGAFFTYTVRFVDPSLYVQSLMGLPKFFLANISIPAALLLDGTTQLDGLLFFLSNSQRQASQFSSGEPTSISGYG
jgi:hypothetical protein